MKNMLVKFKINNITYFMILSFLLTGFIKNILIILLIVLVHELGHIFFLKIFNYEILKVEIFPFGGVTSTEKLINSPINKDILIYMGGIIFQIILYFIFSFLYQKGYILNSTYQLFIMYNKSILIFNILPIKPLDGGEIFLLILQKFFPYIKTLNIANYISIIILAGFILYNIKSNLNNFIIIGFLLYKIIDFCRRKEYFKNKFLLERYLYNIPYKKIEHNGGQDFNILKKETLHFFKSNNKYIHEKEILKQKFDINSYF